ncbi:hypothetical protein [Cupriavidus basilensis]|uniref:Lipoprotein n=1 Tax=Cupriavidus basilensis TaxID=68895 RepID=A0A643FSK2_9BURK|nr:hypothetical protein [Cupriavidus basilensis]QOT82222.1 hypothetical protein F7R26_039630 [Cupriavidus basilensis]
MKATRSMLPAFLATLVLAACGGGGGDGNSAPPEQALPPPPTAPVTVGETTLAAGLLTASGFGNIVNGVEQKGISKTAATKASSNVFDIRAAVAVGPSANSTPTSAFDTIDTAAYWALTSSGWTNATTSYQATFSSDEVATVSFGSISSAPFTWSVKLNLKDVGGGQVTDYLVNAAGAPLTASMVAAALPAGVKAAYPSFAPSTATVIASMFGELDPLLVSEADLLTRSFCEDSADASARVQYQLAASGVLKVFDAKAAGCGAGATALPDGKWETQTLYGKTVYLLSFPTVAHYESFNAYVPASAFAAGARKAIVAGSGSERWKSGFFIPKDVAIQSKRAFLSVGALDAIRTAVSL